jgi:hypothetical protein
VDTTARVVGVTDSETGIMKLSRKIREQGLHLDPESHPENKLQWNSSNEASGPPKAKRKYTLDGEKDETGNHLKIAKLEEANE